MSRPIRLAVDALGAKQSGASVVLLDLLDALIASDFVERIILYSAPPEDCLFSLPESDKLQNSPQPLYERSALHRVRWNAHVLGDTAVRDKAEIVLSMAATMLAHRQIAHVGFVQQSLPFCPEALATVPWQQRVRMKVVQAMTRQSCRSARRVFVQSPTMRTWVSESFAIDPSCCEVVLPSPRLLPVPEEIPAGLEQMIRTPPGGRLLYVGNAERYKNVELIVRALPAIRAQIPHATLFTTWPKTHPACHRGEVVGLGYLRDGILGKAYALADALIQPSLVESGPLTMLEAMGVGTPVLVADRLYARDICGDAALFFDPRDPQHLAAQTIELLQNPDLQTRLVARGHFLAGVRIRARPYARVADSIAALV